ncbi:MAG: hypothetical protein ABR886_09990 [Dehalococcoidales bacterium]|jgi:hypothetical protein
MRKFKKTPSRIKYESTHPTVSARLPKEKQEKLMVLIKSMNITLPKLLLHFIGEYEIKIMPVEEARKKGIIQGYQKAKDIYAVKYSCSNCGKEITVTSDEEKKVIRKFMADNKWHHISCE